MKLEIVTSFERQQRKIDALQQRFPDLRILTRSAFFYILGCEVPTLSQEDKQWLIAMVDAQIIEKYRCKEREDR